MEVFGGEINLGHPQLELIDPTPNIHYLFVTFDKLFFWCELHNRVIVRWSKRMYSCAGVCTYEGRRGLCQIALSEPLLKLRPRKDLVETLLHEMIHAYLFVTNQDCDRDGHGPYFRSHMMRINSLAGLNISIYHDFHDEVDLYRTHWWRCNGPCQSKKPFFGIVRRTVNRAPGPSDNWWNSHRQTCGGSFTKIKEPEKIKGKNPTSKTSYPDIKKHMTNKTTQTIETYMTPAGLKNAQPVLNNNDKNTVDKNVKISKNKKPKEVLNDTSNKLPNVPNENPASRYFIITKRKIPNNPPVVNLNVNLPNSLNNPQIFEQNANVGNGRQRTQSASVVETVRNVWVNKKIPTTSGSKIDSFEGKNANSRKSLDTIIPNKQKSKTIVSDEPTPPQKVKKLETDEEQAMSVLKDVYGEDFKVSRANNKFIATSAILVDCPICGFKVEDNKINTHLDECLNKDVLKDMCRDDEPIVIPDKPLDEPKNKKGAMVKIYRIPVFFKKTKKQSVHIDNENADNFVDLTNGSVIKKESHDTQYVTRKIPDMFPPIDCNMPSTSKENAFEPKNYETMTRDEIVSIDLTGKLNRDKHLLKSGHVKREKDGHLPSLQSDKASEIKSPSVEKKTGDNIPHIKIKCPCCDKVINTPLEQHFDDCLAFFENNATIPEEGASASFANETITIHDDNDDILDETQTLNASGTKTPCPCCMQMVELVEMNNHLESCLAS